MACLSSAIILSSINDGKTASSIWNSLLVALSSSNSLTSEPIKLQKPLLTSDSDPFQTAPLPGSLISSIPQDPSLKEGSSANITLNTRYYRCSLALSYCSIEGLLSNSTTFPDPVSACAEENSDSDDEEISSTCPHAAIFSIDLNTNLSTGLLDRLLKFIKQIRFECVILVCSSLQNMPAESIARVRQWCRRVGAELVPLDGLIDPEEDEPDDEDSDEDSSPPFRERLGVDRVVELLECVRWPNMEFKPQPSAVQHLSRLPDPVTAVAASSSSFAAAAALPTCSRDGTLAAESSSSASSEPPLPQAQLGPSSPTAIPSVSTTTTASEAANVTDQVARRGDGRRESGSRGSSDDEGDDAMADAVEEELMRALGAAGNGGAGDAEGDTSTADTFDSLLSQLTRFRTEASASATDAERRAVAERGMRELYRSLCNMELEQQLPLPSAIPKS